MSERDRLPDRRESDFLSFDHEGHTVHASASFYEGGALAEIFLNSGKSGTLIDIVMRELAVVVSIARQHGVPIALIEGALPKLMDGAPAGPLGKALALLSEPWPQIAFERSISAPDAAPAKNDGAL